MKRSPMRRAQKPMKRTRMGRGKHSVGIAARRRVRTGGALAKGRESLSLAGWRALVARLTERAEGRCENPPCRRRGRLDPHHVVKRSQGGADHEGNLVMICRRDHEATDAPHGSGRLVIARLYNGTQGQRGFLFIQGDGREYDLVCWPLGLYI